MGPGGAKGSSGVEPVIAEIGPVLLWYYGLAYAIGLLTFDL
jgi:prolipoprotein diacylglyceryltransferase